MTPTKSRKKTVFQMLLDESKKHKLPTSFKDDLKFGDRRHLSMITRAHRPTKTTPPFIWVLRETGTQLIPTITTEETQQGAVRIVKEQPLTHTDFENTRKSLQSLARIYTGQTILYYYFDGETLHRCESWQDAFNRSRKPIHANTCGCPICAAVMLEKAKDRGVAPVTFRHIREHAAEVNAIFVEVEPAR